MRGGRDTLGGASTLRLKGTLGFVGCGNMGMAILQGLLNKNVIDPPWVKVFEPDPGRRDEAQSLGAGIAPSPEDLVRRADVVLLAVKPQAMANALEPLQAVKPFPALAVSIAAGISIRFIQDRLGRESRVARVMPNTPALVGAGAAGYALSDTCTADDERTVRILFEAVGIAERVTEEQLDAVTALSGSGPAYFFYLVEHLTAAAVERGLDEPTARRLAAQTLRGAGELLSQSDESPATLRARVTSKGGTTEAALKTFEARGWPETVRAAVWAAANRSRELGQ